MYKTLRIIYIIAITGLSVSLLMISCNDDNEPEIFDIYGNWAWVKSFGGYTGSDLRTPENTGTSRTMSFLKNDTVIITLNGDTVQVTDYFLSREESMLLNDTFDFLTINYRFITAEAETIIMPMRYMIQQLTDTLALDEDVYDGYGHLFIRKN
jgi:hypothetical protein